MLNSPLIGLQWGTSPMTCQRSSWSRYLGKLARSRDSDSSSTEIRASRRATDSANLKTAASAVRNLNDKEVGGRPMRIDYADIDPLFEGRTTQMGQVDDDLQNRPRGPGGGRGGRGGFGGGYGGAGGPGGMGRGLGGPPQLPPNLPQGQPLAPGMGATDSISQTLAALPPNQMLDILSHMKSLVTSSPDQARALLGGHPQLAYALFQAMLMMEVVDPNILQRILASSGALGGGGPPTGPSPMPPHAQQMAPQMGTPQMGTPPMARPPYASGPPQGPPYMQQQAPPPPAPPAAVPGAHLPEEQRVSLYALGHFATIAYETTNLQQLLEQVLQLTPAQISALPPDQQEGIRQLKASLGHG
ncbi:hypothetical protein L7F22_023912 [Adiantum nelumboides]|nr:hypothetical protein [Adiantum nelumboides]